MNKREKGNKRTEQEIPMYPGSEVSLGKKMNPLKGQMRTAGGGRLKKSNFRDLHLTGKGANRESVTGKSTEQEVHPGF